MDTAKPGPEPPAPPEESWCKVIPFGKVGLRIRRQSVITLPAHAYFFGDSTSAINVSITSSSGMNLEKSIVW